MTTAGNVRITDLAGDTSIINNIMYKVFMGIAVGDVAYHKLFSRPMAFTMIAHRVTAKQQCHI